MSSTSKKIPTAYQLFCKANWHSVKDSNPDAKPKEVPKLLGAKWSSMSAVEKATFQEERQKILDANPQVNKDKANKKSSTKKKPVTAYELFCQAHRSQVKEENPDAKFGQIAKLLGSMWQQAKEEDKKSFIEEAMKEKEAFLKANPQIKVKVQKPTKPRTAYVLYASFIRPSVKDENPTLSSVELSKVIGKKWKDLNEEEKATWDEKHKEDVERYQKEISSSSSSS